MKLFMPILNIRAQLSEIKKHTFMIQNKYRNKLAHNQV